LGDTQEEKGPVGQDESVPARFQRLSFAVPRHLRLGHAIKGAAQCGRLIAQNRHVGRVVNNPRRHSSSSSIAGRLLLRWTGYSYQEEEEDDQKWVSV
jgi:hypothetical protein